MLEAFATVPQLEHLLARSFDGAEHLQADLLLKLASAAIRAEAGQTITLVADDEVVLAGTWAYDLELPEIPVIDVTAVAVNGTPVNAGDYRWNSRQLLRRSLALNELTGAGLLQHAPGARGGNLGAWAGPDSTVAVTYSHGFETIPDDLVGVCLNAAARNLYTPAGVRSESLGAYTVAYADSAQTIELTDSERRLIRSRYRR